MRLKPLHAVSLLLVSLSLSACGSDNPSTTFTGRATQGPVKNATIFADRQQVGTLAVQDADEAFTFTDANGIFALKVPENYGTYLLVSKGGTDILTNKPAIQMAAPAGSANVTPLTTLVALAPADQQAQVRNKIEATGVRFDADISASATPAALMLAKSIESAVETLSKAIDPTGTKLTEEQLNDVQRKALVAIAANTTLQPTLLSSAAISAVVSAGVTAAVPQIEASNPGIDVTNTNTLANSVANTITAVATSMGDATGSFSTSAVVSETTQFPAGKLDEINTAINTNAGTGGAAVVVTPSAPTVVVANNALTGIAITSPITVVFSRAMDASTITSASFKVAGRSGTVTYNAVNKSATFTPSAPLDYDTTYAITLTSAIKDVNGLSLVPANLSIRTVTRPLTGSTGSTGNGANF